MTDIPADIVIYALIAAGLIFWLRSILGTRHKDEPRQQNPFITRDEKTSKDGPSAAISPMGLALEASDKKVPEEPLYDPFADEKIAPDAAVREALREIGQKDRAFDPALFLKNAEEAFIMIVEAFADGDKEFLQPLLSEAVYQSFCREIDQRNERGERVVTEINAIRHTEIIGAKLEAKTAYISVSVHAEETCVIKDKNGDVLAGNPNRASEMKDIWVFGRALKSKDPVWQVYETHDDVPEDHKTPIPEAK